MSNFVPEPASFSERQLMRDPATASSRIFVGSIPHEDVTKKDFEHCFSRFGTVTGCLLNRGFGFIQFEDERSAVEAINATDNVLNGRRLDVKPARVYPSKGPPGRDTRDDFAEREREREREMFRDDRERDRDRDRERERERDRERHERERDMFRDDRERDPFRDRSPSLERARERRERDDRDWRARERERFDSFSKSALERERFFERDVRDRYAARELEFRDRPPSSYGEEVSRPTRTPSYRSSSLADSRGAPLSVHTPNVDRTNDCEIIVVNKKQTGYAEYIEARLKKLNLSVDILYPNEDVQMSRVLANIGSRGSLYAILIEPMNEEHKSLTLNILHGVPQVHLNMPLDDAFCLIAHNFDAYVRGERISHSRPNPIPVVPVVPSGTGATAAALALAERHPEAIQVLLNLLADNRTLTVLQYDKIISYLQDRREQQVQVELGDAKDLATKAEVPVPPIVSRSLSAVATSAAALVTTAATAGKPALNKTQIELQHRIMNILNSSAASSSNSGTCANVSSAPKQQLSDAFLSPTKSGANANPPAPVAPPTGVPAPSGNWNPVSTASSTTSTVSPSPLLSDPTIQKALDDLMQGNLLRKISTSTTHTTQSSTNSVLGSAPCQPLFGAYANLAGNRRF